MLQRRSGRLQSYQTILAVLLLISASSVTSKEVTYFYTDSAGTVLVTTDAHGNVTSSHDYKPYGASAMGASTSQPGFTGHVVDDDTDLVYMQARYYDPTAARFISSDPAGKEARSIFTFNDFAYANNNPATNIDPDGRDAIAVVFPNYQIATGLGFKMGGLGHAGIVLVDSRSGQARYYEYGRYDKQGLGTTHHRDVGNVVFQKPGVPTDKSLAAILDKVSKLGGHGTRVEGAYFANAEYDAMLAYADGREAQNNDSQRNSYSITGNNCITFCKSTLEAGGVDTPSMIDPRPNSYSDELRDQGRPVEYDPETKQLTCGGVSCSIH